MSPYCREKLFDEERQQNATDDGEVKIVNYEERLELQRLSISHKLPSTKDDDIVCDYHCRRLAQGRHWRLALGKLKVLGRISHDGRIDPVEYRP